MPEQTFTHNGARMSRNKRMWLMSCPVCREQLTKEIDNQEPFKCPACGWQQRDTSQNGSGCVNGV